MKHYPKWLYRGGVESGVIVAGEAEHARLAQQGYAEAPGEPQEKAPTESAEAPKRRGRPPKAKE